MRGLTRVVHSPDQVSAAATGHNQNYSFGPHELNDDAPQLITACSGKSGAGVTNVSLNRRSAWPSKASELSWSMSIIGWADENLQHYRTRNDRRCAQRSLRTVHEVLQSGPGGIQISPLLAIEGIVRLFAAIARSFDSAISAGSESMLICCARCW